MHGGVHLAGDETFPLGRAQQLRSQHRGQGQREKRRKRHGGGDGDGQLHEQPADKARQEHQRREHRDQDDGGRHHRKENLPRPALGGHDGRLALVYPALDVLDHHDGVVDHEADGQHERQQGQEVDGESSGARTMNVDRRQIGATSDGISAARSVPRNRKFTRATAQRAISMVHQTSSIACRVDSV